MFVQRRDPGPVVKGHGIDHRAVAIEDMTGEIAFRNAQLHEGSTHACPARAVKSRMVGACPAGFNLSVPG